MFDDNGFPARDGFIRVYGRYGWSETADAAGCWFNWSGPQIAARLVVRGTPVEGLQRALGQLAVKFLQIERKRRTLIPAEASIVAMTGDHMAAGAATAALMMVRPRSATEAPGGEQLYESDVNKWAERRHRQQEITNEAVLVVATAGGAVTRRDHRPTNGGAMSIPALAAAERNNRAARGAGFHPTANPARLAPNPGKKSRRGAASRPGGGTAVTAAAAQAAASARVSRKRKVPAKAGAASAGQRRAASAARWAGTNAARRGANKTARTRHRRNSDSGDSGTSDSDGGHSDSDSHSDGSHGRGSYRGGSSSPSDGRPSGSDGSGDGNGREVRLCSAGRPFVQVICAVCDSAAASGSIWFRVRRRNPTAKAPRWQPPAHDTWVRGSTIAHVGAASPSTAATASRVLYVQLLSTSHGEQVPRVGLQSSSAPGYTCPALCCRGLPKIDVPSAWESMPDTGSGSVVVVARAPTPTRSGAHGSNSRNGSARAEASDSSADEDSEAESAGVLRALRMDTARYTADEADVLAMSAAAPGLVIRDLRNPAGGSSTGGSED
jgi:hypothetical protein